MNHANILIHVTVLSVISIDAQEALSFFYLTEIVNKKRKKKKPSLKNGVCTFLEFYFPLLILKKKNNNI